MKFTKPAINVEQQLNLLKDRGLLIPNQEAAKHQLKTIGYYRLAGYSLPFQVGHNEDGTHKFIDQTTFDDVINLYLFDRQLRLLASEALEQIEIAFRSELSQAMSESFGPHWYLDPAFFVSKSTHQGFIDLIKKEIGFNASKSTTRQRFIQHYLDKYCEPELPPSWMIFEILSFGTISQVFKNLPREHQKKISKMYDMDSGVLASWLHAIAYLRNLAAHHQRLWNRTYTIKPIAARRYEAEFSELNRFYQQAVIIQVMLKTIVKNPTWPVKLTELFSAYPKIHLNQMGFPADWQTRELWKS